MGAAPGAFEQVFMRQDATRTADQGGQQTELRCREAQLLLAHPGAMINETEPELAMNEFSW